jgi:acyl-coenzyme A thioesterase PaaI-like protein
MDEPHVLRTSIDFTDAMTSFNGMVHGGLQALLIDEAMTCALMACDVFGATCDLSLRYRAPVEVGPCAHIRVWLTRNRLGLFYVNAELTQEGKVRTKANARFMQQELKD